MTANELITKLSSLPDAERELPVVYVDMENGFLTFDGPELISDAWFTDAKGEKKGPVIWLT